MANSQHYAECPLTGTRYTVTLPFTAPASGTAIRCNSPLLDATLPRSTASALPDYWLAVRALYRLRTESLLVWTAPLAEVSASPAQWTLLAEWAAQAVAAVAGSKASAPVRATKFALNTHTAAPVQALAEWCCNIVSVHRFGHSGLLDCRTRQARTAEISREYAAARAIVAEAERARTEEMAEALARKRNAVRTLADAMGTVCDIMEDLPASGWGESHTAKLHSTTNKKIVFASSLLLKLRALIMDYFPDSHFAGERATQCSELVLQHLEAVALEQAARLRASALFEDDLADAAALEDAVTSRALVSPAGRFSVIAASTQKPAQAVALRLNAALKAVGTAPTQHVEDAPDAMERARAALKHLTLTMPTRTK